jgi:hypothetical protein
MNFQNSQKYKLSLMNMITMTTTTIIKTRNNESNHQTTKMIIV